MNLAGISSNNISLFDYLSACEITAEGMKTISSFLSQDGIVLEELNLSLKGKMNKQHFNTKQD